MEEGGIKGDKGKGEEERLKRMRGIRVREEAYYEIEYRGRDGEEGIRERSREGEIIGGEEGGGRD